MNAGREVWFVVYRPRPGALLSCLGLALAALLLVSRAPGHLLAPELWAEDGKVWLAEAYTDGPRSLCWPVVGYLQTLSRLGGIIATLLPFTAIPLFFALVALAAQLAPVGLLLSWRGAALLPSLTLRLLLAGYYIGQPNSGEVYINLTNAMWHLALVAFLLVVLPKPRTRFGAGCDIAALLLAGLSGPLVLLIAPLAWWRVWEARGGPGGTARLRYAAVLGGCAVIQGAIVLATAGDHRARLAPLGVTLNRLFHILANQIILGGTLGGANVHALMAQSWWLHTLPPALCCLAAGLLGLVALARGPSAYRQLVALSLVLMAAALKSPMISETTPQWDPMQSPGVGDRYYIIPMLAWFATLLVLAARPSRWGCHWLARGLICLCLIGVVWDWRYAPYVKTGYAAAAARFDAAAAGTVVTFPENPPSWTFTLTKR